MTDEQMTGSDHCLLATSSASVAIPTITSPSYHDGLECFPECLTFSGEGCTGSRKKGEPVHGRVSMDCSLSLRASCCLIICAHLTTCSPLSSRTHIQQDMWNAPLEGPSAIVLGPWRDFVLDPSFAIVSIILPPMTRHPKLDHFMANLLYYLLAPLRFLYPPQEDDVVDLRLNAKNDIIINSKAGIRVAFRPPSDLVSAFRGALAFVISATADIVGTFMDRKKMIKWFEAVTEFKAYLDLSGVGDELEEAIYKPLVRGRLLDNIKILNDIQEIMYAERNKELCEYTVEELQEPILLGKRMMRFATAGKCISPPRSLMCEPLCLLSLTNAISYTAYGTEMIRSALDRDAESHHMENQTKAIAFHCDIPAEDIKIMYVGEGGDMKVLRHFVAIDRTTKSVVLALRGTLSISGALVDMQGMDCDYLEGKAHKGIAEMSDNVWQQSGDAIVKLFETNEDLKDYTFIVTGHSLGGGTATLLNIKIHLEKPLGKRPIKCFGFAPPPTYCVNKNLQDATAAKSIQTAIDNCIGHIHDNDCVPFLSVYCIRRLATLMDTVDNKTEHMWFYKRFKLFWEYEEIPQDLIDDVKLAEQNSNVTTRDIDGASKLEIPAKLVIWMKYNLAAQSFEAIGCNPSKVAELNVFCCEDMVSDHMPEAYEDALDALAAEN